MASLIDSLINIMNDENRQYTELLDLSNNKTTAIVKGDVGQLQEIFGKEQKLIDILNRLEMERQSCVADICKILHLSAAEVKVSQIVRLLEKKQAEHDALEQSYLSLKKTVNQLTQVNDNNRLLLKESMDMIDFEIYRVVRNSKSEAQVWLHRRLTMERERMRRQVAWEAQALMPGSNILMAYQDATDIRQYE